MSRGMNPQEAIKKFLRQARELEFYGMHLFYIRVSGQRLTGNIRSLEYSLSLDFPSAKQTLV